MSLCTACQRADEAGGDDDDGSEPKSFEQSRQAPPGGQRESYVTATSIVAESSGLSNVGEATRCKLSPVARFDGGAAELSHAHQLQQKHAFSVCRGRGDGQQSGRGR